MKAIDEIDELEYLQKVAGLKWGKKKYVCKDCEGTKYTELSDLTRKCNREDCGYSESVKLNTAFEGSHLSITQSMQILKYYQATYKQFRNYIYATIPKEKGLYYPENISVKGQKVYYNLYFYDNGLLDLKNIPARPTAYNISKKFKVEQKTVFRLIKRLTKWLPKPMHKKLADFEPEWYLNIDEKDVAQYSALYNLLINENKDPEKDDGYYRDENEMLILLVKRKRGELNL